MPEQALPLFDISLSDDIQRMKSLVSTLQQERNTLLQVNRNLQESMALKDKCIIQKTQDIVDLQNKLKAVRSTIYTDNSAVIANLVAENRSLKETIKTLQSYRKKDNT